ncbi:MAG: DUF4365 domain-containing protein [Deltaproteobacteria bacterium]|nr:DUF4365 domain-containing protein [Deltaproteobacteria bacterium]
MNSLTIDRIGVSKLETLFARSGWFFREQFVKDYGIDAQVEVVENDEPTGQLIAIQIKSGESYFCESDESTITYRPDTKHIEYWLRHDLPVIITLFNPAEDKFYWMPVSKNTIQKTKKAYKIVIPKSNVLNSKNCILLKRIYKLDVPIYRLKRLSLDLEWMNLIKNEECVYAEFEDWVNKSLSRTSIKIFCDSSSGYKELVIPQHYWAGHSSLEILERFIPWADYEMDEDAYEEYMRGVYEAECYAGYDKEDDIVHYSESFDDWYTPPKGILPINQNGEVDTYRVILRLNEIGKSFMTISEYLYDDRSFEDRSFSVEEIV